jgi:hypothetical protein
MNLVAMVVGYAFISFVCIMTALTMGALAVDLYRTRNLKDERKRNRKADLKLYIGDKQ